MRPGPTASLAAALLLVAAPRPAGAGAPVSREAQAHLAQARVLLDAGERRAAIAELEEAFKWSARPNMLYDIAAVFRDLAQGSGGTADDLRHSIEYFRRFLAVVPRDRERPQIERWIAQMQARLAASAAPPKPAPAAVERPASDRETAAPAALPPPAGALVVAPPPPAPLAPTADERGSRRGLAIAGWVLVGAGVAGLVGGGAWYGYARDHKPCDLAPGAEQCPEQYTLWPGIGLMAAAGAVTLGGVVAVVAAHVGRRPGARVSLAPSFGSTGAGLVAAGHF